MQTSLLQFAIVGLGRMSRSQADRNE